MYIYDKYNKKASYGNREWQGTPRDKVVSEDHFGEVVFEQRPGWNNGVSPINTHMKSRDPKGGDLWLVWVTARKPMWLEAKEWGAESGGWVCLCRGETWAALDFKRIISAAVQRKAWREVGANTETYLEMSLGYGAQVFGQTVVYTLLWRYIFLRCVTFTDSRF